MKGFTRSEWVVFNDVCSGALDFKGDCVGDEQGCCQNEDAQSEAGFQHVIWEHVGGHLFLVSGSLPK